MLAEAWQLPLTPGVPSRLGSDRVIEGEARGQSGDLHRRGWLVCGIPALPVWVAPEGRAAQLGSDGVLEVFAALIAGAGDQAVCVSRDVVQGLPLRPFLVVVPLVPGTAGQALDGGNRGE